MKKILIIYPHFPPSNLAGVHRPRLFAQHLKCFGWEPVVLTVDESYYEEELDWNLSKLLQPDLKIEKVKAFPITNPRLIGDLGLRAFFQLYKKARQLLAENHFDFLYIPIPSFYCALLGRWLNKTTGIKYGIDYIDPWVHDFPGSNKKFSRHWWSTQIAKWLEPIAVKKASLITGVGNGYFEDVLNRNPHLKKNAVHGAMPYGGEARDHEMLSSIKLKPYLFEKNGSLQFVYAGALLPKAVAPLEAVFKSIQNNIELFCEVEFHFIGTGKKTDNPESYTIKPLAEKYGLWKTVIFEYPKRIPYLDVLKHLSVSDAIFILGSTEPHYTPSKTYQAVLSKKPVMALLHSRSTARTALQNSGAGLVMEIDGENIIGVTNNFATFFQSFLRFKKNFDPSTVNSSLFDDCSAYAVTNQLAKLLNAAVG